MFDPWFDTFEEAASFARKMALATKSVVALKRLSFDDIDSWLVKSETHYAKKNDTGFEFCRLKKWEDYVNEVSIWNQQAGEHDFTYADDMDTTPPLYGYAYGFASEPETSRNSSSWPNLDTKSIGEIYEDAEIYAVRQTTKVCSDCKNGINERGKTCIRCRGSGFYS